MLGVASLLPTKGIYTHINPETGWECKLARIARFDLLMYSCLGASIETGRGSWSVLSVVNLNAKTDTYSPWFGLCPLISGLISTPPDICARLCARFVCSDIHSSISPDLLECRSGDRENQRNEFESEFR